MLLPKELVNCPLCLSYVPDKKYSIDTWHIVQCRQCSFVYVNPRLKKTELLNLYTKKYFDNALFGYYHYTENKLLRKKNFGKWISDALPLVKKNGIRALDVGCAAGYCLEIFKEHNWEAYGIELDTDLARKLTHSGYHIFDMPLQQLHWHEKFSIITMFDVAEHLTDLHENFEKLHYLLEDDGLLILVTPNYNSLQRKLLGKKWFQFKPIEHINYFTPHTLQKLAAKHGFKILKIKRAGQYCNAKFLKNRISKYGFHFLLPFIDAVTTLPFLNKNAVYIDTASVYVTMQKK